MKLKKKVNRNGLKESVKELKRDEAWERMKRKPIQKRMELIVDADFQYILARLATCKPLSYFATSSFVFLAFFIKGLALGTFFGPMMAYLAVTLNKEAQKTMDYYKMFRMNARDDAQSTRNKGRLSHEHIGCFVSALDSGK